MTGVYTGRRLPGGWLSPRLTRGNRRCGYYEGLVRFADVSGVAPLAVIGRFIVCELAPFIREMGMQPCPLNNGEKEGCRKTEDDPAV